MNQLKLFFVTAFLFCSANVSATLITFDGQTGTSGTSTYSEGGYTFDFISSSFGHWGDGSNTSNTLDWHDADGNNIDQVVRLTQNGGGSFDFTGIDITLGDYWNYGLSAGLGISTDQTNWSVYTGSPTVNYLNVSAVYFNWVDVQDGVYGYSSGAIDNIVVTPASVPEPSTLAIFALGMIGLASRRFKKQ